MCMVPDILPSLKHLIEILLFNQFKFLFYGFESSVDVF